MQTELVFGVELANIAVADCENFLHDIAIFDRNFTTDDPITSGGRRWASFHVLKKMSSRVHSLPH
jgi:hypothetical protein